MLYYRVTQPDKLYRFNGYLQTVGGELFTPAELRRYSRPDRYGLHLKREWLAPVEVKKGSIYWFFGARFEAGTLAGEVKA